MKSHGCKNVSNSYKVIRTLFLWATVLLKFMDSNCNNTTSVELNSKHEIMHLVNGIK